MADDTQYEPQHPERDLGTEDVFAADNISDVLYPRHKMSVGPDGHAADVSKQDPLPVSSELLVQLLDTLKQIERHLAFLADRENE
jgi:hypothetical protein